MTISSSHVKPAAHYCATPIDPTADTFVCPCCGDEYDGGTTGECPRCGPVAECPRCTSCGADATYPGLHDPETGAWRDLDWFIDRYGFAFEQATPYRARWGDAEPARPVIVGGRCERCRGEVT